MTAPLLAARAFALVALLLFATGSDAGALHPGSLAAGEGPESRDRSYQVYVPDSLPAGPAPLLAVLHGCRQTEADMIAIARRLLFDPHWAWKAASELGVFLKYPARYRNANPRIGNAMDFPESAEKRKRMLDVMREEERASQA